MRFESTRRFAAALTLSLGLITPSTQAVAQHACPRVDLTLVESSASSETRPVKLGDETIFVRRNAITTTNDISEIKVSGDDFETLILIKYKPAAAVRRAFHRRAVASRSDAS